MNLISKFSIAVSLVASLSLGAAPAQADVSGNPGNLSCYAKVKNKTDYRQYKCSKLYALTAFTDVLVSDRPSTSGQAVATMKSVPEGNARYIDRFYVTGVKILPDGVWARGVLIKYAPLDYSMAQGIIKEGLEDDLDQVRFGWVRLTESSVVNAVR